MHPNSPFEPSHRGLRNLRPTLMFDLQRVIEKIPPYHPTTNRNGLIDIASSINVLMQPETLSYSKRYLKPSAEQSLQYGSTAGSPRLLAGIAGYVNSYFRPSVEILPSEIMATNGVSALLNILAYNICDPGEGVMYPVPEYGMFSIDIAAQNGLEIVEVKMTDIDDRFSGDTAEQVVNQLRMALVDSEKKGIKVRALLISNPCNPLGRCYSRKTLIAIARFCAEENLHFISDEIYAMSCIGRSDEGLDGLTSVLSLKKSEGVIFDNIHCVSGASKDFGMGGLRLGYLITRNTLLFQSVRKLGAFTWVNSFADKFFAEFLADTVHLAKFFVLYQARLKKAHSQATQFLSHNDITYDTVNSGVYLWIDLERWLVYFTKNDNQSQEIQLTHYLIGKGVYLEPGEAFSSPDSGKFRLVYSSTQEATLNVALNRLMNALSELPKAGGREAFINYDSDECFEKEKPLCNKSRKTRLLDILSCFNE